MNHYLNMFWIKYAHGQVILNAEFSKRDEDELNPVQFPEFVRGLSDHTIDGFEYTNGGLPDYPFTDIDGRDVEGRKLL